MRPTCLNSIYELAKQDKRIVFVGSDLGFGVLAEMQRELPKQFYMCGISEQAMIGMAAGLALEGKIPYVNTIATFLTRRGYEQIALDVALHNLPVRLIGNGGGAVYAPLGPTHVATDDMALMLGLGLGVCAPADKDEMSYLMPLSVNYPGPLYIRLGWGEPLCSMQNADTWKRFAHDFQFPNSRVLAVITFSNDGYPTDVIVTTGNMLSVCLEAQDILKNDGIDLDVIHLPWLFDCPTISPVYKRVFTVEEGVVVGGLASLISRHYPVTQRFGLPLFPSGYGTRLDMLRRYGLTAEHIVQTIKTLRG